MKIQGCLIIQTNRACTWAAQTKKEKNMVTEDESRDAILGYYQEKGLDPFIGLAIANEFSSEKLAHLEAMTLLLDLALQWEKVESRASTRPSRVRFNFWPEATSTNVPISCGLMEECRLAITTVLPEIGEGINRLFQQRGASLIATPDFIALIPHTAKAIASPFEATQPKLITEEAMMLLLELQDVETWSHLQKIMAIIFHVRQPKAV